jgi:hypothetical protein
MVASKNPSIVFAHGICTDGSSFSKLIPPLQADGRDVIAAQYGRRVNGAARFITTSFVTMSAIDP